MPKITFRTRVTDPAAHTAPADRSIDFDTPMDAMSFFTRHTRLNGGYGSIHKVECFRYIDGVIAERQWTMEID